MKKTTFTFGLVLIVLSVKAQWTDSGSNLTTTYNVGIGIATPSEPIHINDASGYLTFGRPGSEMNNRLTLDGNSGYENQLYFRTRPGRIFTSGNSLTLGISTTSNSLVIANTGKVGILKSSPEATFDVNGTIAFLTGSERLVWGSKHVGTTDHRNYLAPRTIDNSTWDWGQEFGYHHHYRAWYFDGAVGVGTQNPLDKFHISGNLRLDGSQANDEIRFESQNGFHRIAFRQLRFYDWDAGGDNLIINDGRVGIGTTTLDPNYKLSVNGSIRSKEVKVEANWSDFVFYDDYELRTLEEVEQHINEEGHLPEIPSEAEVTENGINLGEMDAKLLQKIEELTLYLIEQNKEIRELKELTRKQQADIEQLKSK